jgi:hypothetical protein
MSARKFREWPGSGRMTRGLVVVGLAAALSACTPNFATQSNADVILRIIKITGNPGGQGQEDGDFLNSDVDPVFNDNATIEFESILKNPAVTNVGLFNDILLERYEVVYKRSDGRNQEGVDVPYRISGGMATQVPAGGSGGAAIVVVRHQAKLEPPLLNLSAPGGGALVLTVVAEITIHGRTTSGRAVTTSGLLTINFADFIDQ